jgi:hypothetical protein
MPSSNTGEVDDECCILVVGVKMVYQSLDLVEGHVFITTAALTTALTTTLTGKQSLSPSRTRY